MWISEELDVPEIGPFSRFLDDVRGALDVVREAQGSGKRVVVFASAGTISAAVGLCYGLESAAIMDLSWQLYNASVSQIAFSEKGFGMVSFNNVPHITTADLLTMV